MSISDTRLQSDIKAIVDGANGGKVDRSLPPASGVSSIGDAVKTTPIGAGQPSPESVDSGPSGISSPLTEDDYTKREWFEPETIVSTDGIISMRVRRLKKLRMKDSAGLPVDFVFAPYDDAP
jgi:hypothetical protein